MEFWRQVWSTYTANREQIVPLLTLASGLLTVMVGSIVAYAALKQARTATRQAQIARDRHEEQTRADLQRRITESFTKAVEQLGSDKLQVRLGGIYTLERISRESVSDYWPVMETLSAFVRDQAPRRAQENEGELTRAPSPPADIAAILTVVKRRDARNRDREASEEWRFDLSRTDLRGADLNRVHLERASLNFVDLEGAFLAGSHLQGARLTAANLKDAGLEGANLKDAWLLRAILSNARLPGANLDGARLMKVQLDRGYLTEADLRKADFRFAHLEEAYLSRAHLERASFREAHLDRAFLDGAHLERAIFVGACLTGTVLAEAHLNGANLEGATGLTQAQLDRALGDAETKLPEGLVHPAHWLKPKGE